MNREHERELVSELIPQEQTRNQNQNQQQQQQQEKTVYVIGLDEAGRGPAIGPVVCGAACFPLRISSSNNNKKAKANTTTTTELQGLGDSKTLSENARNRLFQELKQQEEEQQNGNNNNFDTCLASAVVSVDSKQIDELNILEASLHGMERAADECMQKLVKEKKVKLNQDNLLLLVDGPHLPRSLRRDEDEAEEDDDKNDEDSEDEHDSTTNDNVNQNNSNNNNNQSKKKSQKKAKKKLTPKQQSELEARNRILKSINSVHFTPHAKAVVKGDSKCPTISAASILAKVTRDKHVREKIAPKCHSDFNFTSNMGYLTQDHRDALSKHGATAFHRVSFAPVAAEIERRKKTKPTPKKKKKPAPKGKKGARKVAAAVGKKVVAPKKTARKKAKKKEVARKRKGKK